MTKKHEKIRCGWVTQDPIYLNYHDKEWGVPLHDDRALFEFLILEGAQAGLSWLTILKRRDNYRRCFDNFDMRKIAKYDKKRINALLANPDIIRNRLKINATVNNAQAALEVKKEFGSFSKYIWHFVDHKPIINHWHSLNQIPTKTEVSDRLSADLKKRGFKFVGSTICYAFMQAVGLVNDHITTCFRYNKK